MGDETASYDSSYTLSHSSLIKDGQIAIITKAMIEKVVGVAAGRAFIGVWSGGVAQCPSGMAQLTQHRHWYWFICSDRF